ncbi:MAG: hypothetical protein IJS39_16075, partial [Synergistaceae bacterium]|nr:hypothetical protein [Synergistaceae bacterium]
MSEDFVYPLTAEQRYFYDYQKTAPESTMYNHFPILMRLRDFVDAEKLSQAIIKTLQFHPAFLTVVEELQGIPVQRYIPGII